MALATLPLTWRVNLLRTAVTLVACWSRACRIVALVDFLQILLASGGFGTGLASSLFLQWKAEQPLIEDGLLTAFA